MEATFRLDGMHTLRIGNNIALPNTYQSHGYIGLILERDSPRIAGDQPEQSMLAALKPHEARAMASVLLGAATEAKA